MHPLVRDVYKRLVLAGRSYPTGWDSIRDRVKAGFIRTPLTSEDEFLRAVHRGRWWAKELHAVVQIKKYREMNKRYPRTRVTTAEGNEEFVATVSDMDGIDTETAMARLEAAAAADEQRQTPTPAPAPPDTK
jgi:hypothetical protein